MSEHVDREPHVNQDELFPEDSPTESLEETASAGYTPGPQKDEPGENLGDDPGGIDPTAELVLRQSELDEMRQKNVRLQAELENFRKRIMRSMDEERRYASLPLLRDLLPVVDNLQRAITAAEQHENASGLLAGVKMVADQLASILQRHHCEPIVAEGAPFDPHLHEAIAQHPSSDHAPGHVSLVTQVGYQLHDRVVRPAQVIVTAPREPSQPVPDEADDPEI
ncbi:MAG: nucleotide exchange factor GrpE [Pirellulaceae bacterium]